jgi:hypothetical protein
MSSGEAEFGGSSVKLGSEETQKLHFKAISKGETDRYWSTRALSKMS